MNNKNPFANVKANDFTDSEIVKYWVDIPGSNTVTEIMAPLDNMPMFIMGGKGSGKTHLMRYFSYPVQKARSSKKAYEAISDDGYIGIYTKCGGLNADRFSGKGLDLEHWKVLYAFHFELWISEITLSCIADLFDSKVPNERIVCNNISRLLNINTKFNTIAELQSFFSTTKQKLDYEINNYVFTKKISTSIVTSPGELFYELPRIISNGIPQLENIKILYLIDELENLLEYQQSYLQSLIRDRKTWTHVRFGVRRYGILTHHTLTGEKNIEGSEYHTLRLDDRLFNESNDDTYKEFALDLCYKRIMNSHPELSKQIIVDKLTFIRNLFEEISTPDILDDVDIFTSGIEGKSIQELSRKLSEFGVPKNVSQEVLFQLAFPNKPILEKFAIYLFYKDWSKSINLLTSSKNINSRIENYINDKDSELQLHELISKFKMDLLAQAYRLHGKRFPYCGIETIIRLSKGFPRNFLVILKNIYTSAKFNENDLFGSEKISIESQLEGINESSKWYLEESGIAGIYGRNLRISIERLAEVFRINRYSDKPSECSLRAFSVDLSLCSDVSKSMIHAATTHSLLIKDHSGRSSKNTHQIEEKFIINPILSPYWGLPISTRGVIKLEKNLLNSIFDPSEYDKYNVLINNFSNFRNAPFILKDFENTSQKSLDF